jgi:enoyl-CoA hydratase
MTDSLVTLELDGSVGIIRIDDGKANAISHDLGRQFHDALTEAEQQEVSALAIVGREWKFSAGFDLATMKSSQEAARDLLRVGAELASRIYAFPAPVVLGVTGHALAMGAIIVMAADVRIGADGDFKIGMPEVAIGMPLPLFAVDLAEATLARHHLNRAVSLAHIYDPAGALEAGYIDEVVLAESVVPTAIERAHHLGDNLRRGAFRETRKNLRGETLKKFAASLARDLETFTVEDI